MASCWAQRGSTAVAPGDLRGFFPALVHPSWQVATREMNRFVGGGARKLTKHSLLDLLVTIPAPEEQVCPGFPALKPPVKVQGSPAGWWMLCQ